MAPNDKSKKNAKAQAPYAKPVTRGAANLLAKTISKTEDERAILMAKPDKSPADNKRLKDLEKKLKTLQTEKNNKSAEMQKNARQAEEEAKARQAEKQRNAFQTDLQNRALQAEMEKKDLEREMKAPPVEMDTSPEAGQPDVDPSNNQGQAAEPTTISDDSDDTDQSNSSVDGESDSNSEREEESMFCSDDETGNQIPEILGGGPSGSGADSVNKRTHEIVGASKRGRGCMLIVQEKQTFNYSVIRGDNQDFKMFPRLTDGRKDVPAGAWPYATAVLIGPDEDVLKALRPDLQPQPNRANGEKRKIPFLMVRVYWMKGKKGEQKVVAKTFESRSTMQQKWGNGKVEAPKTTVINGQTIVNEGETLGKADLAIAQYYHETEKRRQRTTKSKKSPAPFRGGLESPEQSPEPSQHQPKSRSKSQARSKPRNGKSRTPNTGRPVKVESGSESDL